MISTKYILFAFLAGISFTLACSLPPTKSSNAGDRASSNSTIADNNESNTVRTVETKQTNISTAVADFNAGSYEKAASGFQEILESDPNNLDARVYLGKSFHALRKDDDAINSYNKVVGIKPDHAEANFGLGTIYYSRKQYETSLPYFEKAAKTNFKSPEMLMALGENQRVLKQFDRAIVQYGKVIGFEPNNASAYYGLGLTYIGLNNKIGARQQLQKLEPLNKDLAKKLSDQIGG